MAQASSKNSTRRDFLSQAAGVAAGSAALALVPLSAMAAGGLPDPIFAAIDAHRKASAAAAAASAEVGRLVALADRAVGRGIEVPSMLEPGTTVTATFWVDIEQAIPKATYPDEHAHYLALLDQHTEAHRAITGDTDLIGEKDYAAEWGAVLDFADTVPTTMAGLLAMIIYAGEIKERDRDVFSDPDCVLISNLSAAAEALRGKLA